MLLTSGKCILAQNGTMPGAKIPEEGTLMYVNFWEKDSWSVRQIFEFCL